jgi:hypothetical protein
LIHLVVTKPGWRVEVKEEERLSDGGEGENESVLAGMEQVTPAAQGEFLAIPRPDSVAIAVQKGNAEAILAGYSSAVMRHRVVHAQAA